MTMTTFNQQTRSKNPFDGFDVGSFSTPILADVDGDAITYSLEAPTVAEYGQVNLNHTGTTIELTNDFKNPVVFALPPSNNGADFGNIRITEINNTTTDSFTIQFQEANYLDGFHTTETVSYLVLEAGNWTLEDGTTLEVGTVESKTSNWTAVDFKYPELFSQTPAVFTQIQSNKDPDFTTTRQRSTDTGGFETLIEKEEAINTPASETVGYLAIETGSGTWSGNPYEVGITEDLVTQKGFSQDFTPNLFSQTPNLLASVATTDGGDTSVLRYENLGPTGVRLKVQEEQSLDSETGHTTEQVSFLAIAGSGLLRGEPVLTTIAEYGQVNLNHTGTTIELTNDFKNPVVFALPPSNNGADFGNIRITEINNTTTDSFTIQFQEANYLDGFHTTETVSYLVLEAGNWTLEDGTTLEVGTVESKTSNWTAVDFKYPELFSQTPAVFTQIQSNKDPDFTTTRQRSTDTGGFETLIEKEEAINTPASETVGYLAIETGSGTWSGNPYEVGITEDLVTQKGFSQDFTPNLFSQTPNLLASVATTDGGDTSVLRYENLGPTGVRLKVQEEQSLDSETGHTTEQVSFLAIAGSGLLTGTGSFDSIDSNFTFVYGENEKELLLSTFDEDDNFGQGWTLEEGVTVANGELSLESGEWQTANYDLAALNHLDLDNGPFFLYWSARGDRTETELAKFFVEANVLPPSEGEYELKMAVRPNFTNRNYQDEYHQLYVDPGFNVAHKKDAFLRIPEGQFSDPNIYEQFRLKVEKTREDTVDVSPFYWDDDSSLWQPFTDFLDKALTSADWTTPVPTPMSLSITDDLSGQDFFDSLTLRFRSPDYSAIDAFAITAITPEENIILGSTESVM